MKEYIVFICDGGDRFTRVLQTEDPVKVDHYITKNNKFTILVTQKVSLEEIRQALSK
jgi:hypothetical protein